MRFLADENIALSITMALRKKRHDVFDVKENKWQGKTDAFLVAHAHREGRIILTHDKDFLNQNLAPILLLRFRNQKPNHIQPSLLHFLQSKDAKKIKGPVRLILSEYTAEFHTDIFKSLS